MSTVDHPVWAVYDRLRSIRLSVKYFCCRLQQVERWNLFLEFFLLATAPASAVAGLWLWNTPTGATLWQWIAIPVAVVAVLKPLLNLTKRIKDYESLVSEYRTLDYDLMELASTIAQKRRFDAPLQADFIRIQRRERTLVGKNPESRENAKIKQRCQAEVLKELPAESFFVPS